MARTVAAPSKATVHLAKKIPQELYYECLDEREAWRFPIPNLLFKINIQARYAAVRATVTLYTLPVPIPKKTWGILKWYHLVICTSLVCFLGPPKCNSFLE
jgi:hypothetical protein